jgi:hypothetical protein
MRSASPGYSSRKDFSALRYIGSDQAHVFVIDVIDAIRAELAGLASADEATATRPPVSITVTITITVAISVLRAALVPARIISPS